MAEIWESDWKMSPSMPNWFGFSAELSSPTSAWGRDLVSDGINGAFGWEAEKRCGKDRVSLILSQWIPIPKPDKFPRFDISLAVMLHILTAQLTVQTNRVCIL